MKPILQFAGILLVGALIVAGTTWVVNSLKKPLVVKDPVPVVAQLPECPSNSDSYQNLVSSGQSIELIKNLNAYAVNGIFVNDKSVTVVKLGADEVACGYLYVKSRINGQSLDQRYDSVYINPQGFGGHILRSKTISVQNPIANSTEILLPLESIPYLPSSPYNPDAQNYQISNWAKLLNVSNKINFDIGLSTLDKRGIIDQVVIAYKCWDPKKGEETKNCQLGLE